MSDQATLAPPKKSSRVKMHPLWLRFQHAELEMKFAEDWGRAARRTNRLWSMCALTFYVLIFVALFRLDPDYATNDQWFRLYVCFPLLLAEALMAFYKIRYTRLYDAMYLIISLTCFGNAAISYGLAPPQLRFFLLLELSLIFVFCAGYFRASYLRVLIFTAISLVVASPVVLIVHVIGETEAGRLAAEMFIISCLAATVLLTAYHREMLARRNFRDIQNARSEEARAEDLARLATADSEAKSDFLAAVGSEFELTVLNVAQRSQSAGRKPETDKLSGYMADIHMSARRLQKTVQQIIAVSGEKQPERRSEIDVVSLKGSTETALQMARERTGADITTTVTVAGEFETPILANPSDTLEIIDELISNALKYGSSAASIRCEITFGEPGCLQLMLSNDGDILSTKESDRFFDAFMQNDDRLARTNEGLGLGLTLARNLARTNGGSLILRPRQAGGVTAILNLPVASAEDEFTMRP